MAQCVPVAISDMVESTEALSGRQTGRVSMEVSSGTEQIASYYFKSIIYLFCQLGLYVVQEILYLSHFGLSGPTLYEGSGIASKSWMIEKRVTKRTPVQQGSTARSMQLIARSINLKKKATQTSGPLFFFFHPPPAISIFNHFSFSLNTLYPTMQKMELANPGYPKGFSKLI